MCCESCNGTGKVDDSECSSCDGCGEVKDLSDYENPEEGQ